MSLKAYKLKAQRASENPLFDFSRIFKLSDVYIPSAHSLNLNQFEISQEKALHLEFVKDLPPTSPFKQLRLHVLLPDPSQDKILKTVYLDQQQIGRLLADRREQRQDPLAVINLSCHSRSAIGSWMQAYKQSLQSPVQISAREARDVPVIFGSTHGFGTANAAELMQHLQLALDRLEQIAQGLPATDILKSEASNVQDSARAFYRFQGLSSIWVQENRPPRRRWAF